MRAPLIVNSVINGRRYLTALVATLLGAVIVALGAAGVLNLPPLIWVASIFLVVFGPASAANVFLGYPRLIVSGNLLVLETSLLTSTKVDLSALGAAYVIHYPKRRGFKTELIFRSLEDEAAHRAAEQYPHAPELAEAARTVDIAYIVGHDVEKGEALAAEINRHRGL